MRHFRMGDLVELSCHDPVIHMHFEMWHRGEFSTLEQMLLSLACMQTQRCKKLEEGAVARLMKDPGPIMVTDPK